MRAILAKNSKNWGCGSQPKTWKCHQPSSSSSLSKSRLQTHIKEKVSLAASIFDPRSFVYSPKIVQFDEKESAVGALQRADFEHIRVHRYSTARANRLVLAEKRPGHLQRLPARNIQEPLRHRQPVHQQQHPAHHWVRNDAYGPTWGWAQKRDFRSYLS